MSDKTDKEDLREVAELVFTAVALFAMLNSKTLSQEQAERIPRVAAHIGYRTAFCMLKDRPKPTTKEG